MSQKYLVSMETAFTSIAKDLITLMPYQNMNLNMSRQLLETFYLKNNYHSIKENLGISFSFFNPLLKGWTLPSGLIQYKFWFTVKRPLIKKTKIGFQDQLSLNAGQKYCRMLQESILQYFRPSLSYYLSLRPLFCLFLSDCLRQVLL